jgi:hypothetical protein
VAIVKQSADVPQAGQERTGLIDWAFAGWQISANHQLDEGLLLAEYSGTLLRAHSLHIHSSDLKNMVPSTKASILNT